MRGLLTLVGLLCVARIAARHLTLTPVLKNDSKEFDYFLLVRYHFTVHGLWPNYYDGTWPQFCEPDYKFDEGELSDLEHALEEEWPSFFGTDDTFWEHEWSKHGTCALNVLKDEHKFFKTVLKLHWRYDLAGAPARAQRCGGHAELGVPLLVAGSVVPCARGQKGGACEEEDGSRALLRTGIIVVVPAAAAHPQQRQQQQQGHVGPHGFAPVH
ncbi:Extracellular ribonuclease LE [Tetrabaena socialis]|uniref:Extracellular ribonuclease LE n=1 Tax=Tetrabaena socialis TaxID=47790 RepID=A0A2J8AG55_9CHLO|nr:Extracellular ribonuclease LE [Tetrabaena socialis]|eukprot:PNH11508.1 Extracellular ribonuclease LE [Tetrabaena socialis]